MAEPTPVFAYMEADYLDIGTADNPQVEVMKFFTAHNESPNAQVTEKQYVPSKTKATITTGYASQFPITLDEYKNDEVCEFIRDIAEEQKLGVTCPYYKVRLHQPIASKENTFYARKFIVGFAIDNVTREGGAIKTIDGNMNSQSDVIIGEFNTETKTFTEKGAAPGGA